MVEAEVGNAPQAPELFPDMGPVIEAFWYLSRARPYSGQTPGAIPVSEILGYAGAFDVMIENREFLELIQVADQAYIENAIERMRAHGH